MPGSGRPRVWPVFVAFGAACVAIQVASTMLLVGWAWLTTAPGGGGNALAARLEELALSPAGLGAAALVSATGLGGAALLGALLSPEAWRRRLRLTPTGVTAGRSALVVLGALAVSQALDSSVALLGLSRLGALDFINRVLQRASGGWLVALAFAIALAPGIAEETFFRGYMQTRLAQRYGPALAIAVTAACFGLIHFDLVHTPVAAVLGAFLGWAVERIGSIVPAIVAHVLNNLIALLTARVHLPSSAAAQGTILAACLALAAVSVWAVGRSTRATPPAACQS